MLYFAKGPSANSDRSPTEEASEVPETVEAIDGLLENAAAVGNTVEPVVSEAEESRNLLSAEVSINWDGNIAIHQAPI